MKEKQRQWMYKVVVGTTLFMLGSVCVVGAMEDVRFVHAKVEQLR